MHSTTAHDKPQTAGAADAVAEFQALRSGCGVYGLSSRVKVAVSGKDRTRWLNGMITNNIRDLAAGRGTYNFLLTPQGHIQGDLYAYNRGEHILLDIEGAQAERLLQALRKYIIMDKVELADVSDKLTAVAVQGTKAAEVLRTAGFEVPPLQPLQVHDLKWNQAGVSLVRMASEVADGYEIWLAPANVPAFKDALVAAGATPVNGEALEMARVAAGIPRFGQDIRDRDLPQETGQLRALSFTKGCYIGQEIVERIRSRGAVHRALAGFMVDGPPPAPGAKVLAADKEAGEITSAAVVPTSSGSKTLALGYLRQEAGGPGTVVEIDGSRAVVAKLPFGEI